MGCSAYFAMLFLSKAKTPFKDFSLFDINTAYKEILKQHIAGSQFASYVKEHPQDFECVGRALVHVPRPTQ